MRNFIKQDRIPLLIGAFWGALSSIPYFGLVGGWVEPPLIVAIITLPAFIFVKIDIYSIAALNPILEELFFSGAFILSLFQGIFFLSLQMLIGVLIVLFISRIFRLINLIKQKQS